MNIVILAAGQGKRMHSNLPKVLHPVAGKALVSHVIDTARCLSPHTLCLVYGHGGEALRSTLDAPDLVWALQEPQLGTGHAVQQAVPHLKNEGTTLILYGDVPLIQAETLKRLLHAAQDALAIRTACAGETTPAANVLLAMDADLNGRVDAQDVRAVADSFVYDTALPAAQEDET